MNEALTYNGFPLAFHNPRGVPIAELPVIYGFNNGGRRGWFHAVLITQDGEHVGDHVCSDESFMPGDLGCFEGRRPDRHERFRERFPDGYRMEFIPHHEVERHEGLTKAIRLCEERGEAS